MPVLLPYWHCLTPMKLGELKLQRIKWYPQGHLEGKWMRILAPGLRGL